MTFEKYEKFAIFIAKVLELVFQVAVINTSTQVCVCMFRVCELRASKLASPKLFRPKFRTKFFSQCRLPYFDVVVA